MLTVIRVAAVLCIVPGVVSFAQPQENTMSIGPRFQQETCYDSSGLVGKNVSYGARLPEYKDYGGAQSIKLSPAVAPGLSVEEAIHRRKSVRSFSGKPATSEQLTRLLIAVNGLTQAGGRLTHRSIPSAGALNPLEIYVVVSHLPGIDSGLYHFRVQDTSLEQIKAGQFGSELQKAALGQESVGNAPLALVVAARFARTTQKYADRGYRYVYVEVGCAAQNVYLQATSLGLGTVAVGAFEDAKVNELLGLDGQSESALLIMPIGYPAE